MAAYLTTREVAQYLHLNQKKVYELVAQGRLPAARVSGKWLFPQHLIDEWVEAHTVHPATGLMGALLDEMLVIQGSDDWLFSQIAERYHSRERVPVVSARIGSLAGLEAIATGHAHLAGCHVTNAEAAGATGGQACYLVTLCRRTQGLIFDQDRHPQLRDLHSLAGSNLCYARRQPLSGTELLATRCLAAAQIGPEDLRRCGPFSSHLELALAVRRGTADVGVGTLHAAQQCGLCFLELAEETYKLAVPLAYAGHRAVARFLDFVLDELGQTAPGGVPGYAFADAGMLETVRGPALTTHGRES
jgi:putative molybdopterin biosynthesis protein